MLPLWWVQHNDKEVVDMAKKSKKDKKGKKGKKK